MPVVVIETPPEGVPLEAILAVGRVLDVSDNPPPGLIVHAIVEREGRPQLIDVWETEEAYRAFEDEQVQPTIERIRASRGAPPMTEPHPPPEILRTVDFAMGRRREE
jgi:hypothetical protein